MARVSVENVSKTYEGGSGGGFKAVDSASFTIEDQELMVLVGPSGCGKTTLLRMVAGLEEISAGTIRIGDQVVNDVAPRDRDIAMVFQSYALYPHMSVYENMAFGLKLRKLPKPEIDSRVRSAAETLGLTAMLDRKPRALSGGQRQRVAVGRAIVRQPKVFLFDEPLSNLDAALRVQMRSEINQLHHRLKATMIYVTHDQVEAMTMADRIVVMRAGKIEQIDTPLNLYHRPAHRFVAGFIGSPSMNFLSGRVEADGGRFAGPGAALTFPAGAATTLKPLLGRELELGIRPEDIFVGAAGPDHVGFAGAVGLVEPMGSETYVHFRTGDVPILARLGGDQIPHIGETVALHFDPARAHLFDTASGAAAWHGGSPLAA